MTAGGLHARIKRVVYFRAKSLKGLSDTEKSHTLLVISRQMKDMCWSFLQWQAVVCRLNKVWGEISAFRGKVMLWKGHFWKWRVFETFQPLYDFFFCLQKWSECAISKPKSVEFKKSGTNIFFNWLRIFPMNWSSVLKMNLCQTVCEISHWH